MRILAALLVLVCCARLPALAEDLDIGSFPALEALAQRVEREGFKRFTFAEGAPRLPGEKLRFAAQGNTVEKEKEFRRAWMAEYGPIAKEVMEQAQGAAKAKKGAAAKEAKLLMAAVGPRWQYILWTQHKHVDEIWAERDRDVKKFLRRYDFGPKIAKAEAAGTAVIDVQLAPDTYEVVRRTVYGWKFQPLKDEKGADVKAGSRRVEFTEALSQSDVREGLRMLGGEVFAVRYARWEKEKETDLIRITGARLLLGTYYFIEHEDRLVVAREPAAR